MNNRHKITNNYLKNCYLGGRPEDAPIFTGQVDGTITVRLDGYAIIPMEEFNRLRGVDSAMTR